MMQLYACLFVFIRGLAINLEPESLAEQDTGVTAEEWMDQQESEFEKVTADGSLPLMSRMVQQEHIDMELDTLFELGLGRVLDGIAAYLATHTA
jgi:hypothetical protein